MRLSIVARVCLALTVTAFATPAQAAGSKTRSLALWGNPGAIYYFGQLLGGVDFRSGAKTTLGPVFGGYSKTVNDITLAGPAFGARLNFQPKGTIGQGLRFSGLLVGSMMSVKTGSYDLSTVNFMLQGLAGYHFLFGSFTLGIGAGASLYSLPARLELTSKGGERKNIATPAFTQIAPAFELSFGAAL